MTPKEFEELVEVHRHRLVKSAMNRYGDVGEDFVQEALLRAFADLQAFKHDSTFTTWIHGFLPKIARDYYRNGLEVVNDVNETFKARDNTTPEDLESYRQLVEICAALPEKQREALQRKLDGDDSERKNLWWARQVVAERLDIDD
jgi:RNA polymerase sigma factor (sigma-70 family)